MADGTVVMQQSGRPSDAGVILAAEPTARDRTRRATASGERDRTPWVPIVVVGWGLAIVGMIDVALVWFPTNFSSAEWEFGTITRTFNGLALATVGIGAVAACGIGMGSRWLLASVGVLATIATLAIIATGGLYALVAPVAIGGAPEQLRGSLMLAIGKTSAFALVYLAIYSFLAFYCFKRFHSVGRERHG
jgi:hypothetical protein